MPPFDFLARYKLPDIYTKNRIGKANDGGYVIADPFKYDCLISAGISDDSSFEREFLRLHSDIPCFAFDSTIASFPQQQDRIMWWKKNISSQNGPTTTNLHELIDKYHNIMLKMDIENGEYDWLPTLSDTHLSRLVQIVIEFHSLEKPQNWIWLQKLSRTHWLVHVHANNFCRPTEIQGVTIPHACEFTFVNKCHINCDHLERDFTGIPGSIDQKNVLALPETVLVGYPYTEAEPTTTVAE